MTRSRVHYEFGDFVLDAGQQCLRRADTGETVALTAKLFETLLYLVEHAGETLDKDVLLRAIWPDVIVEENSLTQNISLLRQLLGETRGENRYIATIARKGYRFVARVTRRDEPVPLAATSDKAFAPAEPIDSARRGTRPTTVAAAWVVAVVAIASGVVMTGRGPPERAATHTLAILPFKPLSPDERNESLELGVTESLIATLSQEDRQAISALSSVRKYAALDQDAIAAGRELGVDVVLEGFLQRRDDQLRVSVRLLRVNDGRQLWAQRFDQKFTTIFQVQDTIAARVSQALSPRSAQEDFKAAAVHTRDAEAYALYASGRFAWTRQTEQSLLQAIDFFEQAIVRDPNYALAYAGLADSYALLGVFGIRAPSEVFPQARSAAEKALALDPNLGAAHSALGHIKVQFDHDWEGADRAYSRAARLEPSVALTYHRRGLLYAMQGDTDRALAAAERAQQLEPLWLAPRVAAANALYYAKRHDESIRLVEELLTLDDRADNARTVLIRNLIAQGDYERALKEVDKRPIQTPGSNALRAQALALSGRRAEAIAERKRVLDLSQQRYVAAYDMALIDAALADIPNTILWLERAIEDRSTLVNFLAQEPMFDSVHADPRFASLVQRMGIHHLVLPGIADDP